MKNHSIASLSLDLDNKWTYMKTHGDPGWESFPSYLDVVVPRVLNFLGERNLQITFFVVGQDAAIDRNREVLASIAEAGHEIGNHSFSHEPWFHIYSEEKVEAEIAEAERHLERVTGQRPIGFRGPGFSSTPTLIKVLMRRGYVYDASSFPTFLGPLARTYYFLSSKWTKEEWEKRSQLFGSFKDGLRPLRPYRWNSGNSQLLEIPVTTMPIFRIPIHVSYLLYLSRFSSVLARAYFRFALALCRLTGTQPSLLLHPLDFLGCDDTSDLAFFPAMDLPSGKKVALATEIIDLLGNEYKIVSMNQHAMATLHDPSQVKLSSPMLVETVAQRPTER